MDNSVIVTPNRMHPLMVVAAASVTLVSLLGVAAITGIIPSSHGTVAPPQAIVSSSADQSNLLSAPARYVTADGKVLEVVPETLHAVPANKARYVANTQSYDPAPAIRHRTARQRSPQYSQNTYSEPANTYQQPYYAPQQHPVVNYVNDMHPVGTGVGAVLGGLVGNQVGGGNGKKLATVAGVLMGGYAGNEIAHNRSPLPGQ